ncbi:aspartate aminotransferase family protein [Anaerobiospirillum thomasii]|uniref:Acetylornithine aminotransferase n=1 Tax=Anaerobiospirillum thomasii TaxID=179995 RepID=A0A2X0VS67_9GAMM|nr:aspartate aminotransferase family protein [Anaerobiospirillum thomasii]SPT70610.1 Acetylornithine aminotransferase [Anaerobiospirillum thomasii]
MKVSKSTLDYINRDKSIFATVQHIADLPFVISKAQGFYLYDTEDKAYLDFTSGACTMNLGYDRAHVADSTSFPFPYALGCAQIEYGSRLIEKYTFYKDKKMMFCVTGSDANDGAIKIVRAYSQRKMVVTFSGNYHGTTYGAASLTSLEGRLDNHLGPMLPYITILPFCPYDASDEAVDECLARFTSLDLNDVAGVFLECIQGDTGMLPINTTFLERLNAICKEHKILIVSDEVQMACYRTGPFFSIENYPFVKPDLITMGKHIGGGIPLGAIIGRQEVMQSLKPCEHAFSMAGNFEACMRGLYNFNIIEDRDFKLQLAKRIALMDFFMDDLCHNFSDIVIKCCGVGLARAVFVRSLYTSDTDNEACYKIICSCFGRGLYLMRIGSNWLRLEPFLNMPEDLMLKAFDIIKEAFYEYRSNKIDDGVKKYMS